MKKLSKKYQDALKKIENNKLYKLEEAIPILLETSTCKFDASVEIHMNLNVDVRHADQIVRGTIVLPHGTGKKVKIAAFVESDLVNDAKNAGAELAGLEELIEEIKKGNINFDIAIAQPQVMKKLGQIAKTLGTKGLMPNPKAGTVTANIVETITEIKKGKVEYKTDKNGIIHGLVGKVSFKDQKILENSQNFIKAVIDSKPSGVKGVFLKSIALTTTMGPSIRLDLNQF